MAQDEIAVAGLLADQVDQAQGLLDRVRVGVDKNRVVLVALGGHNKDVRHLTPVQLAFLLFHLRPLRIIALGRVHLSEGLHGQKEDQLEMGHPALDRPAVKGGRETLAGGWHGDPLFYIQKTCGFLNIKK